MITSLNMQVKNEEFSKFLVTEIPQAGSKIIHQGFVGPGQREHTSSGDKQNTGEGR